MDERTDFGRLLVDAGNELPEYPMENERPSPLLTPLQLLFLEPGDPRGGQGSAGLRSSLTPTKKVEMDRTVMPDGTIVTTVTTIQSRPKLDRKLGQH